MTDLLDLIGRDTELKRVASTNGGEYAGPCPFCGGRDRFRVWPDSDPPRWWCRQCGKNGDTIAYMVMRGDITPQEAGQLRRGERVDVTPKLRAKTRPAPRQREPGIADSDDLQARAMQIAIDCAAMLWEPEGAKARAWLNARGLADETLKAHLVGFNREAGRLHGFYVPRGITIPHWQESVNTMHGIKVRLPTNGADKYRHILGSRPSLYLADNLAGHDVAVVCEGEFDALLLHQEAGDAAGVCALGSASNKDAAIDAGLPFLLACKRLLVATDNDEDGERAAETIMERTSRARRLRPPEGNDITDSWKAGVDLRSWVRDALDGLLVEYAESLGGVVTRVVLAQATEPENKESYALEKA
jgi:DNA primase